MWTVERRSGTTEILAGVCAEVLARHFGRESARLLTLVQLDVARPTSAALTDDARSRIRARDPRADRRQNDAAQCRRKATQRLTTIYGGRHALREPVEECVR